MVTASLSPMADPAENTASLPRIERLPGPDDNDQTFVLHKHDHTLGNSLRFMIQKDPRAEFCGLVALFLILKEVYLRQDFASTSLRAFKIFSVVRQVSG